MLIAGKIFIPDHELLWQFTQSGGPGGQNVNKVATAVRLSFNLRDSASIPLQFRELLLTRLDSRLNEAGELVVTAREERTQLANRRNALAKLQQQLESALVVRKKRKPTSPGAGAVRRRLESKSRHSLLKRERRNPPPEE